MSKRKRKRKILVCLVLTLLAATAFAVTAFAAGADPGGASYTFSAGSGSLEDVGKLAGKAFLGANYTWVMICAFMVFFFQCGFAMVETGFCRGKNAAHTMTMNFMVFLIGAVGFFLTGFAFQMGGSGGVASLGTDPSVLNKTITIPGIGGILGYKGFLLGGTFDASVYAAVLFPHGFHGHDRHHSDRSHGGTGEVFGGRHYLVFHFHVSVSGVCKLGVGRRLAFDRSVNFGLGHGVVDFAGIRRGAFHGRHARACRRYRDRTENRQVQEGRDQPGLSRT
jgi:Amt family ammonium transporter